MAFQLSPPWHKNSTAWVPESLNGIESPVDPRGMDKKCFVIGSVNLKKHIQNLKVESYILFSGKF